MRKLINKSGTAQTNCLSSLAAMIAEPEDFFYVIGNPTDFLLHKNRSAMDATRCIWNLTACGSLHLARKEYKSLMSEGYRELKRTCPLCYVIVLRRKRR